MLASAAIVHAEWRADDRLAGRIANKAQRGAMAHRPPARGEDTAMTHAQTEIASQPECWGLAAKLAGSPGLPLPGERVAVAGCGTSWFMAKAYATLREQAGHGETDAFQASEFPLNRRYDRVVTI